MSLKDQTDVSYYRLNNEINIPSKDGKIRLEKDKEALDAFIKENVIPNTVKFDSLKDRLDYLTKNNYIEASFLEKYPFSFIEKLYQYLED